jgi:uncharacterized membrane protein
MRRIILSGIAILLPTVVTLWVLYKLFLFLDGILRALIARFTGFDAPGIGVAAIVGIVLLAGLFASNVIGKRLLSWYNRLLERIPFLSWIYRTLRQVSDAVLQDTSRGFKKVCLVEFPRTGSYSVGFVTSEILAEPADAGEGTLTVFVPTSPNPTSGFMLIVRSCDVRILDMSVEEGVRLVVTAGMMAERDVDPLKAAIGGRNAPAPPRGQAAGWKPGEAPGGPEES